jgi:hypothetical protein
MRRTVLPLLSVLALLLVAVGGAAGAGTTTPPGGADVGVCVVGADSPCNDAGEPQATHPTPANGSADAPENATLIGDDTDDSEDSRIWIPEDRNRDGEIDERFHGDPAGDRIGAGEDADRVGAGGDADGTHRVWIPEDRDHDGRIDDRFVGTVEPVLGLAEPLFPF